MDLQDNNIVSISSERATELDEQSSDLVRHFRRGLPGTQDMSDEQVLAMAENLKNGCHYR